MALELRLAPGCECTRCSSDQMTDYEPGRLSHHEGPARVSVPRYNILVQNLYTDSREGYILAEPPRSTGLAAVTLWVRRPAAVPTCRRRPQFRRSCYHQGLRHHRRVVRRRSRGAGLLRAPRVRICVGGLLGRRVLVRSEPVHYDRGEEYWNMGQYQHSYIMVTILTHCRCCSTSSIARTLPRWAPSTLSSSWKSEGLANSHCREALNHVRDAASQCATRADERLLCQLPQPDIGGCPLKLQALQHGLKCAWFPELGPFNCWQAFNNHQQGIIGWDGSFTYLSVGQEMTKWGIPRVLCYWVCKKQSFIS